MRSTVTSGRVSVVLSGLALLVALSGTAYAANTVRSTDIVDGAVRSRDLGNGQVANVDLAAGAVTTGKIADGTVTSDDVADNSLTGTDIDGGTLTPDEMAPGTLGRSPRLFARVVSGSVIGGFGVTGLDNPSAGSYQMGWGQDVDTCAIVVTPEAANRVVSASSVDSEVFVAIVDRVTGAGLNTDFSILVVC